MTGPQRKPNVRTLSQLVIARLAADDAAEQAKEPEAAGTIILRDEECRVFGIRVGARPRGRPKYSPAVRDALARFVREYTPWARYTLRYGRELRRLFGREPAAKLWFECVSAHLTGQRPAQASQAVLAPQPTPAQPPPAGPHVYNARGVAQTELGITAFEPPDQQQRLSAVTEILSRFLRPRAEAENIATRLCEKLDDWKPHRGPSSVLALSDGRPASVLWFVGRVVRVARDLPPQYEPIASRTVTEYIGRTLFSSKDWSPPVRKTGRRLSKLLRDREV
jgi:hypothetical protein